MWCAVCDSSWSCCAVLARVLPPSTPSASSASSSSSSMRRLLSASRFSGKREIGFLGQLLRFIQGCGDIYWKRMIDGSRLRICCCCCCWNDSALLKLFSDLSSVHCRKKRTTFHHDTWRWILCDVFCTCCSKIFNCFSF